jgi:hypothetical protein
VIMVAWFSRQMLMLVHEYQVWKFICFLLRMDGGC